MVKVKVTRPFFDKQAKIYREVKDRPFELENERAEFLQKKGLVEPAGEEAEEKTVDDQEEVTEAEMEQETQKQGETAETGRGPAGEEDKSAPKKGKGKSKK